MFEERPPLGVVFQFTNPLVVSRTREFENQE